jgi:hypothetical protein
MPGMMGMYNYMTPEYMTNMSQRIETSQLNHASNMHGNVKDMEVRNNLQSSNALAAKTLNDGDIQCKISELKSKIDSGDLQGAVTIHSELKQLIYNRYKDEIADRGSETNVTTAVLSLIDDNYHAITNSYLKTDIEKCGESPFKNGFNQAWKKGHSKLTIQEALHEMYGTRIDAAASEKTKQVIGKFAGGAASMVEGAGLGAIAIGALGTVVNLGSLLVAGRTIIDWSTVCKGMRWGAVAGALGNTAWKFI